MSSFNPESLNEFHKNFLSNNSEQMNQINALVKKSTDSLLCGPDCQKMVKTDKLKQLYLDAQTNIISAPDKLKEAQRKYYMQSEGVAGYDKIINEEIMKKANKIEEMMQLEFDSKIVNLLSDINIFSSLDKNYKYMLELYKEYLTENKLLESQIKKITTDIVTNDRKTFYEDQNYDILLGWYKLYTIFYIILIILFVIFIFLANIQISFSSKILMIICFIIYPFIINPIALWIISSIQSINNLLPKNIYKTL